MPSSSCAGRWTCPRKPSWLRRCWTTTFGYILNTALTRMGGGDPAAGDHMEVHLQMLELLAKVRGGPDPTAYSERQLRWEIVDRERWLNSFIPAPITDLKLVKWRHWKPSRIKELGPINQKVLEGHLRRKWAERLLAHLIPHAGEIPHLAPLRGDNEELESWRYPFPDTSATMPCSWTDAQMGPADPLEREQR